MSSQQLYKFEPADDITTKELALIFKTFLLAIHQEEPNKNLEVMGELVDFFVSKSADMSRHFVEVGGYD